MKLAGFIIISLLISQSLTAQKIISLYDSIPNQKVHQVKEIVIGNNLDPSIYLQTTSPTIEIYHPKIGINKGAAVIIFPGGAYQFLAYKEEGTNIAKEFAALGITACVVKYRLPNDSTMIDKAIGPMQDAEQAIKLVRQHASDWNIEKNKIGVIGFSAGGHLASSLGTRFNHKLIKNEEEISLRPDFMILFYPVISMRDSLTHIFTRMNLLGNSPSIEKIVLNSNEDQVNPFTPPTYITHAEDDKVVSVNNSIQFYLSLLRNNIPAEMHLYPSGDHGFILREPTSEWLDPVILWMKKNKFL